MIKFRLDYSNQFLLIKLYQNLNAMVL